MKIFVQESFNRHQRLFVCALLLTLVAGFTATATNRQINNQPRKSLAMNTETQIRTVLNAQVAAWNRGDIEGFMTGYDNAVDTSFVSGDTVTRGWATVLARYQKSYDSKEKMGTLNFSELEFKELSKDAVLVIGRWQLARTGDAPRGRFTLVFQRRAQGWRITHDHTSNAS